IPLEGAIEQLCRGLGRGALAADLQAVAADLARGVPLADALEGKRLPELYIHMVRVGAAGNNLSAILQLLADHYRRVGSVWTRLKGLLFYPVIVLLATLGISLFLSLYLAPLLGELARGTRAETRLFLPEVWGIRILGPPAVLAAGVLVMILVLSLPSVRRWLRWSVSPFREASLAQAASALSLMLRGGCSLDQALQLMEQLEKDTPAGLGFGSLQKRLADGHARFAEMAAASRVFPVLFTWMVDQGGEDMAAGLERAAQLYRTRADQRTEMLLYAALPTSILVLGSMLFLQLSSVVAPLVDLMQHIAGD
ncbi:type II secretion system F family protein, partial [bacterium]|nr:type II secretion system F family protein [bacterium]